MGRLFNKCEDALLPENFPYRVMILNRGVIYLFNQSSDKTHNIGTIARNKTFNNNQGYRWHCHSASFNACKTELEFYPT